MTAARYPQDSPSAGTRGRPLAPGDARPPVLGVPSCRLEAVNELAGKTREAAAPSPKRTQAMNPLFAAARALEKHGWVNEAAGSPEHGMCLLGALGWVTGCPLGVEIRGAPPPQRDLFWQAMDLLHDVIEELFGCNQVAWVNDNLIADQDQAVAILEKAGARLEEAA